MAEEYHGKHTVPMERVATLDDLEGREPPPQTHVVGIDRRTGRAFGDHGTAMQAVDFALDHLSVERDTFLKCWREGDLDEWPEFYRWLANQSSPPPQPNAACRKWHLGSMNDGLFIIDTLPRPSTDDIHAGRTDGPSLVLKAHGLSVADAQAICDAHNTALAPAPQPNVRGLPEGFTRQEIEDMLSIVQDELQTIEGDIDFGPQESTEGWYTRLLRTLLKNAEGA